MTTTRIATAAALIVGSGLVLPMTPAQQAGIKRTDLQRHDLARTIHAARNTGRTNGAELATYVTEKGKPLLTMVR